MKIFIKFSTKTELERLKYTINRKDWYLENGYTENYISLPANSTFNNLKNKSDAELLDIIKTDYDENRYLETKNFLNINLEKYLTKLESVLSKTSLPQIKEVTIYLTHYGVGGSYNMPNKIFLNINKHHNIGAIKSVIHELIHLYIENIVNEHSLDQKTKELLVEIIISKIFSDLLPNLKSIENKDLVLFDQYPRLKEIVLRI